MTATSKPAPAKPPKRLTLAFLYATWGEMMLYRLGTDKSCEAVFPEDIREKIYMRKKDGETQGEYIKRVVKPVMEAFLAKACPVVRPYTAQWVFDQYMTLAIKAADLQKVRANIAYFNSLKDSRALTADTNPDLMHYKSYTEFKDMLGPYRQKKAKQEEKSRPFHLEDREKAQILAGTTVLYNGPEGMVVIPHTLPASERWGNHTQWCIAAWRDSAMHFSSNNAVSPIIMLLPKGQEDNKIALVNNVLTNCEDVKIDALPKWHQDLMDHCLAGLSENARRNISPWLRVKPASAFPWDPVEKKPDPVEPEVLKKEMESIEDGNGPDATLWRNSDFALDAILHHGSGAFEYIADELKEDFDFILSAVEMDDHILGCCADEFKRDYDIICATLRKSTTALCHAAPERTESPDFMTRLLLQDDDLPFKIRGLKDFHVSASKDLIWQPDDTMLMVCQIKALERMAEKGDMEKFVNYSRHFKCTWGDPDTLFAADPAATLAKIRAEVAAQYPQTVRPSSALSARMGM